MALPIVKLNDELAGAIFFRGKHQSVPYALPGDQVQFSYKNRKFIPEKIERSEIGYDESIRLADPFCKAFGQCGGCRGQHLDYSFQLALKTAPILQKMLQNFGIASKVLPSEKPNRTRNRMDFAVNATTVGLRPAGSFDRFVDLESCPMQSEFADSLLKLCREELQKNSEVTFTRPNQGGCLKYITIRTGRADAGSHSNGKSSNTSSGIVILGIEESGRSAEYESFVRNLTEKLSSMNGVSLVETVSNYPEDLSCTSGGRLILGTGAYSETLGGQSFLVPYDSFFQPNPRGFDALLSWVRSELDLISGGGHENCEQWINPPSGARLLDLYCGAGVLSKIFSNWMRLKSITGFEVTESAIQLARKNCSDFAGQLDFQVQDLNAKTLIEFKEMDIILVDPPRAGLSPTVRKRILSSGAGLVVYISCNPKSQVVDLGILAEKYKVVSACIADCFPQTPHLEQAVILVKRC